MTKRVIPWALPSIKGGSVGGYTPAPTPTPPEPEGPYTFDDLATDITVTEKKKISVNNMTLVFSNVDTAGGYIPELSISGVKINDASSVSSVKLFLALSVDDYEFTVESGSFTGEKTAVDLEYDITAICTPIGGVARPLKERTSTGVRTGFSNKDVYCTISGWTITKIQVYNANGVVIQEWTPEDPEPEENGNVIL